MRQTKAQIAAANEAAIKEQQQQELRRLRAEKAAKTRAANKASKVAPEVAAHAAKVQPQLMHANIDAMVAEIMGDLELPSAGRVIIGLILSIGASFTVGYGIGMLLSYALAGIITLHAASWVAFAVTVLAWIIALYAAWKIGGRVGGAVFSSVVLPDGLASRSITSVSNAAANVKGKALGWFASSKQAVQQQFSGAHVVEVAAA